MDYLKQLRPGRCSFIQTVVKWGLFPYLGKMPTGENGNFAWTRTAQLAKHASQHVLHQGALHSVAQKKMPISPTNLNRTLVVRIQSPSCGKRKKKKQPKKCRLICGNKQNPIVKDLSALSCLLVKPAAMLCTGAGLPASTANCRTGAWIYSSLAELTAELKLSATIFKLITHGHSNPTHVIAIAAFRH